MVNVSCKADRRPGLAKVYLLDNPTKRKERREYVAVGAVGGAMVGTFFEQLEDNHVRFGKAGTRVVRVEDEHGRKVPKLDSLGRPVLEKAFVQHYSLIQGFGPNELDPRNPEHWERAQKLGRALASAPEFDGHMALVVTEIGGNGCLHNHIIIDAVNRRTGASLKSSKVTHHRLARTNDRVLAENRFRQREDLRQIIQEADARQVAGEKGFSFKTVAQELREQPEMVAEKQTARHEKWIEQADQAEARGEAIPLEPFSVEELQARAHAALEDDRATSWDGLNEAARERGVTIQPRGDEVQIGLMREQPDGSLREPTVADRRRGSTLDGLSLERIEQALERNRERVGYERRMAERQRLFDLARGADERMPSLEREGYELPER